MVDGRDHLDQAVLHRHLDAKPAELAVGGLLHFAPGLLVHVARMRIKCRDHAADRTLDQLGVVRLFDGVGPDALEYLAEQVELRKGIVGAGGSLGGGHPEMIPRPGDEKGQAGTCYRAEEKEGILAHCSRTFSLSVAAHHGPVNWTLLPRGTRRQLHNTFLVSLRPFCHVEGWVPKPRLARVPNQ